MQLLPAVSFSAPPLSQTDLDEILKKFVNQGAQQLYKGTFVYLSGDEGLQTFRVSREEDKQGIIREIFVPLDNNSPESKRLLKNQYCRLNNGWKYQFQAFSSSFPFRINNKLVYLQKNYKIKPVRLERVAGLNARHISVSPRDRFRYGYELWFEPETGILLKYQLKNDRNENVEQYLFSTIQIQQPDHIQQPRISADNITTRPLSSETIPICSALYADNAKKIAQFINQTMLPPGFQIISYRQNHLKNTSKQAQKLHLSDGLASVSVFIEELDDSARALEGIAKIGPLTVAGKSMDNYQISVVGAVPVDTAIVILDSIKK